MTAIDAVNSRIQQLATGLAGLTGGTQASTDGGPFAATLEQVQGGAGAASVGSNGSTGGAVPGDPGATLPAGVTGQDIVSDAQKYLGIPYVFGGQSSSGMDCSGLVRQVMGDLGLDVGHSVVPQAGLGTPVASLADAQPGDLIVMKGDEHVAIYAGNGQIIEAPREGENVVQRANWIDPSQIETIRRVTGASTAASAATGATAPDAATLAQLAAAAGLPAAALQQLLPPSSGEGSAGGAASTDGSALSVSAAVQASSAQTALSGLAAIAAAAGGGQSQGDGGAGGDGSSGQQGGDAALLSALAALAPGEALAPQASAQASAASPASTPLTQAPQPLAQQLTQPIMSLVREPGTGDQTVVVKVSPEQYGPITVTAHSDAAGLHIQLTAPNGAGHDVLAATMTDLRRDLASNGISASLSLGLSADGGGAGQGGGQQAQQDALDLLARSQDQAASAFAAQAQAGFANGGQAGQGAGRQGDQNGDLAAQSGSGSIDPLRQVTNRADAPMVLSADATEGAMSRIGITGLDVLA